MLTHTHAGRARLRRSVATSHAPVILKRGCYIAGAIILQGVTVGDAIIGAVTRDVPPQTTVEARPPVTGVNLSEM